MSQTHTDREYEADLHALREMLLLMGGQVEEMIRDALLAAINRDAVLAKSVMERDKGVNRAEVEVDKLCLRILALRQPAASDLRFVTFALKIVTDVERIGDLAVNVAQRAAELAAEPPLPLPPEISLMSELVQQMLHLALDAFVRGDADAAEAVAKRDDEIDELYRRLFRLRAGADAQRSHLRRPRRAPAVSREAPGAARRPRAEPGRDGDLHGARQGRPPPWQPPGEDEE